MMVTQIEVSISSALASASMRVPEYEALYYAGWQEAHYIRIMKAHSRFGPHLLM